MTQWVWSGTAAGKATVSGSAAFTIAGPNLSTSNTTPSSFQITFTPIAGNGPVTLNVLPVNSGNTFLIQGINDKINGVCQMF